MKANLLISLLFMLLFNQTLFSQKGQNKQIKIIGFVKDNSTFLPISNAQIKFSKFKLNAITDSNGRFELSGNVPQSEKISDTLIVKNTRYWDKKILIGLSDISNLEIPLSAVKQRLIVTTDIGGTDPDDEESMVHLMVAANEIDIEGIICGLAWLDGHLGIKVLNSIIDSYGEVLPNLKLHAKGYPSYERLKSVLKTGQTKSRMEGVGEGKDSPGSELIISVVDNKEDPRPIWLDAWGGTNTIAQALWKVKNTRTRQAVEKFIKKIRIYDVLGQDDAGAWMAKTFPDLKYIRNKEIYGWAPPDEWSKENIQSKGPLGAKYPKRIWATEGDSPAFLHVFANGLNDPNKIDQGGWGGRFSLSKVSGIRSMDIAQKSGINESVYDPYFMYTNTSEGVAAINIWKQSIWNDFATRMIWSVTDNFKNANHHPTACIGNDCTNQVLEFTVKENEKIKLDAGKSNDSDGDKIFFKWQFYKEPSSYQNPVSVFSSESSIAEVAIPADAAGKTITIILEVTDEGIPKLTSYRRVVFHIIK